MQMQTLIPPLLKERLRQYLPCPDPPPLLHCQHHHRPEQQNNKRHVSDNVSVNATQHIAC